MRVFLRQIFFFRSEFGEGKDGILMLTIPSQHGGEEVSVPIYLPFGVAWLKRPKV